MHLLAECEEKLPFLISITLLVGVIVRLLTKRYKCPFPENLILLIIVIIINVILYHTIDPENNICVLHLTPRKLISIYIPIFVTATMHQIDHYILIRCIWQVVFICIFNFVFTTGVMSFVISVILHTEWTYLECIPLAMLALPIEPNHIVNILKDLAKFKYLATMLEAESIVMVMPLIAYYRELRRMQYLEYKYLPISIVVSMVGGGVIGFIMARIQLCLYDIFYNDAKFIVCISVTMTYVTHFIVEVDTSVSSGCAVIVLAWCTSKQKHRLTTEVDAFLTSSWDCLLYVVEISILVLCTSQMFLIILNGFQWIFLHTMVLMYFATLIVRITAFIVFLPILKRLNKDLNRKSMLVLSWSGIKGPVCILYTLYILADRRRVEGYHSIMNEVLFYIIFNLIINCTLMQLLLHMIGYSELSMSRFVNMSNCTRFITGKRDAVIDLFKTNRYLSNTNWHILRSETVVLNPYSELYAGAFDTEEDEYYQIGDKIVCTDCKREVPLEFTEEELAELIKESDFKVLRAKKSSFYRQYQDGSIDKECLQVLIRHIEIKLESTKTEHKLDIAAYMRRDTCLMNFRNKIVEFLKSPNFRKNNTQFGSLCYYITQHISYDLLMYHIGVAEGILLILNVHFSDFYVYKIIPLALYIIDFLLKIIGLSHKSFPISGLLQYIKVIWYLVDLVLMVFFIVHYIFFRWFRMVEDNLENFFYTFYVVGRLCNVLRFVNSLGPIIVRKIDNKNDKRIYFGYTLASALLNCNDNILDNLSYIVDNKVIQEHYKNVIAAERIRFVHMMDDVQRTHPWIAITVKTKRAIRTALTVMEETLSRLKLSGFIDNIEYNIIKKSLFKNQKLLHHMSFVQASSPKVIFKAVPWLPDSDPNLVEFLYKNVRTVEWIAGDVIADIGTISNGIYILVTGMLRLRYIPISNVFENGLIPIVDYVNTIDTKEEFENIIVSGNTIGELCMLTGRKYDCKITAESSCQAYWLSIDVLREAMKINNHPVFGLETQIWKFAVTNLAVSVLMNTPQYAKVTQEQIKVKLQGAFMPNLRCYKIFVITEQMEDIVLIEGIAINYVNREVYIAPMCIPPSARRLTFPWSSQYKPIHDYVQTRILIVPAQFVQVTEIMEREENIGIMMTESLSDCFVNNPEMKAALKMKERIRKHTLGIISVESDSIRHYNPRPDLKLISLDDDDDSSVKRATDLIEGDSLFLIRNRRLESREEDKVSSTSSSSDNASEPKIIDQTADINSIIESSTNRILLKNKTIRDFKTPIKAYSTSLTTLSSEEVERIITYDLNRRKSSSHSMVVEMGPTNEEVLDNTFVVPSNESLNWQQGNLHSLPSANYIPRNTEIGSQHTLNILKRAAPVDLRKILKKKSTTATPNTDSKLTLYNRDNILKK